MGTVEISILGISLGDFLCPHGSLQPTFRELLKLKCFNIRVAILADGSNAAIYRAILEEYGKFEFLIKDNKDNKDYASIEKDQSIRDVYDTTKCHDELKTATDYLHDLVCRQQMDRNAPAHDESVEATLHAYVYRITQWHSSLQWMMTCSSRATIRLAEEEKHQSYRCRG